MRKFLVLTVLWIAVMVLLTVGTNPNSRAGWDLLAGWLYLTVAYIFGLICLGFWNALQRFRDSMSEPPQLDHPGHRRGLVRTAQLPGFMRDQPRNE